MVQFPQQRHLVIERVYEPDEEAIRRAVDILLRDARDGEEGRAA